jgi:hypothetical protein
MSRKEGTTKKGMTKNDGLLLKDEEGSSRTSLI